MTIAWVCPFTSTVTPQVSPMKRNTKERPLYLLAAMSLAWSGAISAATVASPPVLLLPNDAANPTFTFPSYRTVLDGYGLTAFYFDDEGNSVSRATGAVYSSTPGSFTWTRKAPSSRARPTKCRTTTRLNTNSISALLPFDGSAGFWAQIVTDPIDAFYFI